MRCDIDARRMLCPEFLNKFSILCERKLQRVQQQSQRLEIVLALLEAKLGSIHWLNEGGGVPPPAAAAAPAAPQEGMWQLHRHA